MNLLARNHGKFTSLDITNYSTYGWGICDLSGLRFQHTDLVHDMQYAGNSLQWTGLMVSKRFLRPPNPQEKIPPIKSDPYPIPLPRPDLSWGQNS